MSVRPSRFLNEKSGFMGLSVWDMAVLGYLLVLLQTFLGPLGFDWVSFSLTAFAGYLLVSIRLRRRRKTIRDFLLFQFHSRGVV